MLAPGLIAVLLVTALLALIPARRLYVSGQPTILIGAYFVVLWLLGILVALGPGRSRLVVPLILVLYLIPFIAWRAGIQRLLRRAGRSAPRTVSPPAEVDPGSRS